MTDYDDLIMELERKRDFSGLCREAADAIKELADTNQDLAFERDQLRAVAVRLKGALEEILRGGIHDVQFFARDALTDPEVEKL